MDTVGKVGYSLTSDNRWCEGSEMRGPGAGMRDAPPPGVEAHQIDGDRCDNVLESRFGEPAVPRLAQFEGTDSLGQGAFDPSPSAVALLPLLRQHQQTERSEEHTSELQSQFHLVCR